MSVSEVQMPEEEEEEWSNFDLLEQTHRESVILDHWLNAGERNVTYAFHLAYPETFK